MSYSVKKCQKKNSTPFADRVLFKWTALQSQFTDNTITLLTVSNELYYILINNSMIKRVIKKSVRAIASCDSSFYFQNLYISKVV